MRDRRPEADEADEADDADDADDADGGGDAADPFADALLRDEIGSYYRSIGAPRRGAPIALLGIIEIESIAEARRRGRGRRRRVLCALATVFLLAAGTARIVGSPPSPGPAPGPIAASPTAQAGPRVGADGLVVGASPEAPAATAPGRGPGPEPEPGAKIDIGVGGAGADRPVAGRIGGAARTSE